MRRVEEEGQGVISTPALRKKARRGDERPDGEWQRAALLLLRALHTCRYQT